MDPLKGMDNEQDNQQNAIKAVKLFKKKRRNKKNALKRPHQEINNDEESVVVKKVKTSNAINTYSTGRKKLDIGVTYEQSNTAMSLGMQDGGATRTVEIDKKQDNKKSGGFFGPKQASGNIRVTCRFDYQPDICKDWKETGYCGYGDTCKFLHDRGDYKTGWQLDKEWEEKQKNAQVDEENYEINEEEEDNLPFACYICREDFVDPVVTHCEHYFCEKCILQAFKKSLKCPICQKHTDGILKVAKDLIIRQKLQQGFLD
eukprot:CAMPEP_0206198900 /NCGR_PEP_ID=MMETSP0166-20121206/9913_1 /ASSEMBLY_ACC=CAM_ASM_000260 /TAXON_ID=95228 /ORGANISM="Vannella robusta, Strain DIVA3 518/3/11/1/6" /LENGTH=258 /DNA_ID=CAMNT_0053616843 /DNA_START=68 /DNA_END=841 /DNA_ORIENTATION=+